RIAQREHNGVLALQLCTVSNADNIQIACPSLRHAANCVGDKCTCQSVDGRLRIVLADHMQMPVFLFKLQATRNRLLDFALWAFDDNCIAVHRILHAFAQRNWLFSYTRHLLVLFLVGLRVPPESPRVPLQPNPSAIELVDYQTSHNSSPPTPSRRA